MEENKKPTPEMQSEESKTTIEPSVNSKPTLVEEKPSKPTSKRASKLSADVQETRKYAWLAYILFFIPLLINKNSQFVRHNANEGLEINIFDAIAAVLLIVGAVVTTSIAWIQLLMIIFTVIGFGLLVLTITTKVYMIIASAHGKTVSTPWMWNLRIIK